MTKKNKNKFKRYLLYAFSVFLGFVIFFEVAFTFFGKPIIKRTLANKIYESSEGVYSLSFNKVKINVLSGNYFLTEFELIPDTNAYFQNSNYNSKNLYHIQLDTFQIRKIRFVDLIKKDSKLTVQTLNLSHPQLKIFGVKQADTSKNIQEQSASYETVKTDVISSAFSFVNSVDIATIKITDGNFDFLKPRADNPNPFTVDKVTFILKDFHADSKTFSQDRNDVFSEDIKLIIDGYKLKMNDNIHVLSAEKVLISTIDKTIELKDINMNSGEKTLDSLSVLDANIFDFKIDNIILKNANFKEIYVDKHISIGYAAVNGFETIIYSQKEKSENIEFNKDSLLNKIDIYPLFSNFVSFIKVDTLKINSGNFKSFKNLMCEQPKTIIRSYDVNINDFLVDSSSIDDTARTLYAKDFKMNIFQLEQKLNDSIHTLVAKTVIASSKNNSLQATGISIFPDENLKIWAIKNQKSFNYVDVEQITISGFSFNKFFNYNRVYIDTIGFQHSDIYLNSFNKQKKDRSETVPLNELFMNFADKMIVKNIDIETGFLKYRSFKQNKTTFFTGNFKLKVFNLSFNPYNSKVTKQTTVDAIDVVFSNLKFDTPDSIYNLTIDELNYSTYKSKVVMNNLNIQPINQNLISKLKTNNKSSTIKFLIPNLEILNTNLSNAFQADSLSLNEIILTKPYVEIVSYPNIKLKNEKDIVIDSIKAIAVEQLSKKNGIVQLLLNDKTPTFDSVSYELYNIKKQQIDSLFKLSFKCIDQINVSYKNISKNDTVIQVIEDIISECIYGSVKIALENYNEQQADSAFNSSVYNILQIKEDFESPKLDLDEIFVLIGQFLPKISSEKLSFVDGMVSFKSKTKNDQKLQFRSAFELNLNKFNFDSSEVKTSNKILFSQSFVLSLKNMLYNHNDNLHQITVDNVVFNSENKYIDVNSLSIIPKIIDTNTLTLRGKIGWLRMDSISFKDLFFNNKLNVEKISLRKPDLNLYFPRVKKTKQKTKKDTVIPLPPMLNNINVKLFQFWQGKLSLYENWDTPFLTTNFTISVNDIIIDSVINKNENTFLIPLSSINVYLKNFKFITKDSSKSINFDVLDLKTEYNSLILTDFNFTPLINDSIVNLDYLKNNNNFLKVNVPVIEMFNLDYEKLRFDKELHLSKFSINNPFVEIKSYKKDTTQEFNIDSIDLYKNISKHLKSIYVKNIYLNNIDINNTTYSSDDTSTQQKNFNKISFVFNKLKIDSTTTITKPYLFYAEDFKFNLRDFNFVSKDSVTSFSFSNVSGSTKNKSLQVLNFKIQPTGMHQILVDRKKVGDYRKADLYLTFDKIFIPDFNYKKAIKEFEFDIDTTVIIDTILFVVKNPKYKDHKLDSVYPHLLEPLFGMNYKFNVKRLDVKKLNLIYNEYPQKYADPAILTIKTNTLIAHNITNDTAMIDSLNIETTVEAKGVINDSAKIDLNVAFNLKSRGKVAKVSGAIGEFSLHNVNSYLGNAFGLEVNEGVLHSLEFEFYHLDYVSYGNINIAFSNIHIDNPNEKGLKKFKSKAINLGLRIVEDSKKGVSYRWGNIAKVHEYTCGGDIKMWIDALISGFVSAFIKTKNNREAQKEAKVAAKIYEIKLDRIKRE